MSSIYISGKTYASKRLEINKKPIYMLYDTQKFNVLEKLDNTHIGAFVLPETPRILKVYQLENGKKVQVRGFEYPFPIMGVRINRYRLVVCLKRRLYIHNIKNMELLHTIPNITYLNVCDSCICALSTCENNYLAYPDSFKIGTVQIFDTINMRAKTMIHAHSEKRVRVLVFTPDGTRIATVSEKGNVIRVFSVIDGIEMFEIRQDGYAYGRLSFSRCGSFICSTTSKRVEVFKLDSNSSGTYDDDDIKTNQVTDLFKNIKRPTNIYGFANADIHHTAFAHANFMTIEDQLYLLVLSRVDYKQTFFIYNINREGGKAQGAIIEPLTLFSKEPLNESLEVKYKHAHNLDLNCISRRVIKDKLAYKMMAVVVMLLLLFFIVCVLCNVLLLKI